MPAPGDPSTIDCTQRLLPLLEELRAGNVQENGEWLARVADVIRPRRRERPEVAAPRLRTLTRLLVDQPDFAAAFNEHLGRLLCTRMHRILYADPGSLTHEGFTGGLLRRSLGNLLPPATDNYFLRDVVAEVFDVRTDHVWLEAIPRTDWNDLLCAIGVDDPSFAPARRQCRHELLEALRLAAVRLAALGSDAALLQYQPALARHESPFLAQAGEVHDLILRHVDAPDAVVDERHLDVLLDQCDGYIESIRRRSREAGVGVSLVVLLARMEQLIARMRILRDLVTPKADALPDSPDARRARALDFFLLLVRQENRRNSVRDQISGITELLARRVTEQASRSGEHYLTSSRSEFVAMYRAAAGAGLIIAVLALVKLVIAKLHLPLLWEGVAFSLNYGLGFVLIHVLHMTIATKQPAMTAATLAASLDGRDDRDTRLDALAELAAEVSRTQWLSIAGNVTVTLLTAFAIAMTAVQFLGWNPADPVKSAHLLHDLHPWKSLALFHAAIAGVYLFLSGLISGYYDNLSLYHHVPQRLRRVKWLRSLLGEERLARLSTYVEHNLGALAGNFLFGCMLGFTPIVGQLVGLPLDIRHVAFASANLGYGLVGVQFAVPAATILVSAAGVLLVGLVNLVVSFALALKVALRSRGITREQTEGLSARVLQRFLRQPRDFFWPPASEPAGDEPSGSGHVPDR
jgi:site-specific recombinase